MRSRLDSGGTSVPTGPDRWLKGMVANLAMSMA